MIQRTPFRDARIALQQCTSWLVALAICNPVFAQHVADRNATPQLAIVSLKFVKTAGNPEVSIVKFRVIQSAKIVHSNPVHPEGLTYNCIFTNSAGDEIQSIALEDPLNPRYEYPDEDGVLQWVRLPQDENEILIRFPYSSEMQSIQIVRPGERHEADILCTIPLPKTTE
jgi:hypothetical protein